ncbi:MAG: hypothetical protein ACKOEB_02970, partial [Actinomycetota bacterium]
IRFFYTAIVICHDAQGYRANYFWLGLRADLAGNLSIISQNMARMRKSYGFNLRGISHRWFDVPVELARNLAPGTKGRL